jgi:hypothetical protein
MAGVIKQRDIGTLYLIAEILHGLIELRLIEIKLRPVANKLEAKSSQRLGYKRRVILGIIKLRDISILGISNNQSDTRIRPRRQNRCFCGENNNPAKDETDKMI